MDTSLTVPDLAGVPEDDDAEPDDAEVQHVVPDSELQ